jgi:uncharacterized protein YggE
MKQLLAIILINSCPLLILNCLSQAVGNSMYGNDNRYNYQNAEELNWQNSFNVTREVMIDENSMTFEVNGLFNRKADAYLAIFNMTQVGENASVANDLLNSRYQNFVNEVASAGVKPEDVFLDMVSQVPIYELEVTKKFFSKTYNEVPKGFELQKNIHVKFNKGEVLDKILTAAAKHEIYDLIKVDYFVENTSAVYETLRDSVIAYAKRKTNDYKQLNVNLDTVYRVLTEQTSVTFPIDRYSKYQPASSSSIESVGKKSGLTEIRKPVVMFYNKLSYHNFDVVINPVVVEPLVQYTCKIKMRFSLKKPVETKIQNHYKVITPTGDVKSIEIK